MYKPMITFVSVILRGSYAINIIYHILCPFLMMTKGEKKMVMVSIRISKGMFSNTISP